jgi:uncharacterized protein (TIGR02147 family)
VEYPLAGILKRELHSIQARRPQYSLRSFAKELGLSPASLSKILSGRQRLSEAKAAQVAKKLGLSEAEAMKFCETAKFFQNSRGRARGISLTNLDLDLFEVVADWRHLAILEWISLKKGKTTDVDIANGMGLSKRQVRHSLKILIGSKLIEIKDPGFQISSEARILAGKAPNRAIREYHRHLIKKAVDSIVEVPFEQRNISNAVIKVSPKSYPEIVRRIEKFRNDLSILTDVDSEADRIYSLNLQLFPLSKV